MDPFVHQLRDLCAAHPTRAKWVFVRSHAIGRTLADRLVLEGTDWANLRFVTPLDVAVRMGAPFLVERGIDPSEEGLGPALIMRLLLDLPGSTRAGQPDAGYFRPLASQPQMAAALWSTIRELRMAGVEVAAIENAALSSEQKRAELVALYSAYESYLTTENRGDLATVFAEALKHPDWCPIASADCWTEQPDVVWPPLVRRLIDSMPGQRLEPRALDLPGSTLPRRLSDARVARQSPDASTPLAFLMRPEEFLPNPHAPSPKPAKPKPPAPSPTPLALFHSGGSEAEVESVFRRILTSAVTLDQCEIVCASPHYPTLVWEKAMRYDWPVTLAQGIPAALTRPGRALLALTEWIEDDFAAGRLRRMLQSGDIGSDIAAPLAGSQSEAAGPGTATLSAGRAASLLLKAQAAWGRATYRLSLERLAKSSRAAAASREDLAAEVRESFEARAAQADALAAWIDALITAIPEPGQDDEIDVQQVAACARLFVERYAARASALDAMAARSLVDAIGELGALGGFRCPLGQALRFLRERVDSVVVGVERPRPGHLHVSSLATAAFAGRRLTFVVGLEEGRVFPAPFEDPILLDVEREAISPALARSADRTDEAVFAAFSRLAVMSAGPVFLSYSCRDLREYRETYASWLLLQAYRVTSGNPAAIYKNLHDHLGAPSSCVPASPADALAESRWWLHGAAKMGDPSRSPVLARYPPLESGARALAARALDTFSDYDGHVPEAGAVLDPCRDGRVVSATQLENAAECPFRHFLERGLGVSAIESGERDRDVWLDPLLRGSLLHDLYAQLMRRCRKEKRRAALPGDGQWLRERGQEKLDALAVEMPPPSTEVRDRETRLFLDDLAIFVEAETQLDSGRTPIGFEVGFGRSGASSDEPLAVRDPLVITAAGLTFRLVGQIDRIDQVGPATFEIVDYKTGGYWADDWKGKFAGGTRLQHALYGLAAHHLLASTYKKATVSGAEYYFSSAKGQQERKRIETQSLASVGAVLADLRQVIASGLFIHAADERSCKWCDFGHACGQNAAKRAEAKMTDPALAPFVRLAAHD